MCLRTNSTRKSTVKNPIRCLKVVAVSHTADGSAYHSFYTFNGSIEYKIGATVDMNEGRTEKNKDELRTLQDYRYRSGGPYASFPFPDFKRRVEAGLHTFSPEGNGARSVYEWGKKESEFYNNELSDRDDIAILECEIPTGAHYYKGIATCFNENYQVDERGYVSDKLHVIRVLSEEEIKALPYVEVPY